MTPRALSFFLCLTFLLPSPYLALRESQEDSAVSELARQLSAGLEEGAQQGREMRVLWEEMGRVLGGKRRVGSSRRYRALDFLSAREEETLRNFLMAPFSWERARTDLLPPTRIGEIRQILKRPPERFRRYEKGETTPEVLPRLARVILMIGAREGGKIPANTDVDPRHLDQFRSSRYWDRESGIVARRFRQSLMERIQRALAPYQDHRPVDTSPEAFEEAYAAIEAAIKKQPQLSSGASPALGESQEERPRNDQSRQELGDLRGQWQQLSKEVVEQIIELARRKGRAQEPISQATGGRLRLEDRTQKKGNLWSGREDLQWTDLKQRLEEGYFGLNVRFEDLPFSKRRSGSPQKKMVLQVTSLNKEKREIPTRIMALRDLLAQLPALGLLSGLEERLAVALEQSPVLELREGLLHAPNGETIRMPGAEELPQEGILVAVKGPFALRQAQGERKDGILFAQESLPLPAWLIPRVTRLNLSEIRTLLGRGLAAPADTLLLEPATQGWIVPLLDDAPIRPATIFISADAAAGLEESTFIALTIAARHHPQGMGVRAVYRIRYGDIEADLFA